MGAKEQPAQSKRGKTAPAKERKLRGLAGYLSDPTARDFDRLIYERVRLGIMSALSVNPKMSFTELRDLLGTSDGNLSVHARKLEEAHYINCNKTFEGRTPRTEYKATAKGRRALERYLDHMESLIQATRNK
ncbi:MAG: transcriptional regulator [Acidobacteriota bacterium]|nr:transcriptional regulator [Acidobacteriota bacterium]MDH3785165.1 transcriptional regulator [Acidobacteriota bacterium]